MKQLLTFYFLLGLMVSCEGGLFPPGEEGEVKNNPKELTVTGNATEISYASARISAYANIPIELGAATYGVIYSTDQPLSNENGIMIEATAIDTNNKYSVTVDGLSSNTKYYYASFVQNGRVYQYGEVKRFNTLEVKAEIKTEPASEIGAFSAILNGYLKLKSEGEPNMSTWFLFGTDNTVEGLKANGRALSASMKDEGLFSFNLTGLSSNTTYFYVSCALVYDRELSGGVQSFQTLGIDLTEGAVDMGLSVKWASCNLGATKPEEYGDYYAWGETEPYYNCQNPLSWKDGKSAGYDWPSYKWCNGSNNPLTKYNTSDSYGTVDNRVTLETGPNGDDAASKILEGKWRMPTNEEWTDLWDNCTWTWRTINGVSGRLVTSNKNDNAIFLPAAGCRDDTDLYDVGIGGYYWSSSLNTDWPNAPDKARYVYFNLDRVYWIKCGRYVGFSVRPVSEK